MDAGIRRSKPGIRECNRQVSAHAKHALPLRKGIAMEFGADQEL